MQSTLLRVCLAASLKKNIHVNARRKKKYAGERVKDIGVNTILMQLRINYYAFFNLTAWCLFVFLPMQKKGCVCKAGR